MSSRAVTQYMMKQRRNDNIQTKRLMPSSINRKLNKDDQIRISALLKNHDMINIMFHNFLNLLSNSPIVVIDY